MTKKYIVHRVLTQPLKAENMTKASQKIDWLFGRGLSICCGLPSEMSFPAIGECEKKTGISSKKANPSKCYLLSTIVEITNFIIFLMSLLLVGQVSAAEFLSSGHQTVILIEGEIKPGDFKQFNRALLYQLENNKKNRGEKDLYHGVFQVYLNSPGGNVEEALLFANMFRKQFFRVGVDYGHRCFSSCTIMFAGGVDRYLDAQASLGFHRLSLVRKELDIYKTKAMTDPENVKVTAFLRDVGFPSLLIEKMNDTPPSDIYIVDEAWLKEHELFKAVKYQPAFTDVIEKLCGTEPNLLKTPDKGTLDAVYAWVDCKQEVVYRNRKNVLDDLRKNAK